MYCTSCGKFAGGAARCAGCGEALAPAEGGMRPPAIPLDLPFEHERTLVPGRGPVLRVDLPLDRRAAARTGSDGPEGAPQSRPDSRLAGTEGHRPIARDLGSLRPPTTLAPIEAAARLRQPEPPTSPTSPTSRRPTIPFGVDAVPLPAGPSAGVRPPWEGAESAVLVDEGAGDRAWASLRADLFGDLDPEDDEASHPHAELGAHALLEEPVDAGVDPIDLELGTMLARGRGPEAPEYEDAGPQAKERLALRRIGAWAIDAALLALSSAAILLLGTGSPSGILSMASGQTIGGVPPGGSLVGPALIGLMAFVYFTLCWSLGGRTLGAHLVGVRTVDRESGEPLAVGRAALRAVLAIAGTLAFLAGPLWAFVDPDGEALHDKLAGSSIVTG